MDDGTPLTDARLRERVIELGPWHSEVQITPTVSTAAYLEAPPDRYTGAKAVSRVGFQRPKDDWMALMRSVYPDGLQGRSFMESACNCGAYCFWAKELGAGATYGFDVRQHWIDQAEFLLAQRQGPNADMRFELRDLYALPAAGLAPFDVVMFQGIFYHLPDPITGLKIAADLAREVILLDTAMRTDMPDGCLVHASEGTQPVMTGVYGMNWFPTGPAVLERILRWLGFVETKVVYWRRTGVTRLGRTGFGRIRVLGSRQRGRLAHCPEVTEPFDEATDAAAYRGDFSREALRHSSPSVRPAKPDRRD